MLKPILVCLLVVSSCRTPSPLAGSDVKSEVAPAAAGASPYTGTIQPLFDSKCVACHACTQSPCQVNLTSYEGVRRGAYALDVYARRLTDTEPKRLFVDATTEADWRAKGFWPVVGSGPNSILWEMLALKSEYPDTPVTENSEDVLLKSDMCPAIQGDDVQSFRSFFRTPGLITGKSYRAYGMPYGLPALSSAEVESVRTWLDAGAPGPTDAEVQAATTPKSQATADAIKKWETFLNGPSLQERLVARYIYEHLFLAHIFFSDDQGNFAPGAENEFYALERNGQPTRHPYDDPAAGGAVTYHFRKMSETIVRKNHLPYPLSDKKLARVKELFFDGSWQPTAFPPYGPDGSNPFRTFIEIPAWARYQYLLDDAKFFTRNDIRGPVCSGELAVNVIQDLNWRIYLSPLVDPSVQKPDYFTSTESSTGKQVADLLAMPAETQAPTIEAAGAALQATFLRYQSAYVAWKDKVYASLKPQLAVADLWNGNGNLHHNLQNGPAAYGGALQTIFRNYDNSEVIDGLFGNLPKTVEIFDYPTMERTYYDLVAGFDVYSSSIAGYNIRAYKDALRIEGEDSFLKLAPYQSRKAIRNFWYYATPAPLNVALRGWMDLWNPLRPTPSAGRDTADSYPDITASTSGEDAAGIVMRKVLATLGAPSLDAADAFNAMPTTGKFPQYLPEVSVVRVGNGGDDDHVYSILANRFRTNIKFMLAEAITLVPERDSLTVIPNDLVGPFPNLLFQIKPEQVSSFIADLTAMASASDYKAFRAKWAVARNDPGIWDLTDWLYRQDLRRSPVEAGHLDLSRYELFYR